MAQICVTGKQKFWNKQKKEWISKFTNETFEIRKNAVATAYRKP